jgi:hypothetical protein
MIMELFLKQLICSNQRPDICIRPFLSEEANDGQILQVEEEVGLDIINAKMTAFRIGFADGPFPGHKVTQNRIIVGVYELVGHMAHGLQILQASFRIGKGVSFWDFAGAKSQQFSFIVVFFHDASSLTIHCFE